METYFKRFGVMIDCSRNSILNIQTFKKLVDYLSILGYNNIMLYTEDTYEVEGEPYFGYLKGRYSINEIKEMDEYAKSKGIELTPCIQTLAHLAGIFRYVDYMNIKDIDDILLVDDEKTYTFIDHLFNSLSKAFSSRNIHIGMDEAFMLGRGKYLDKYGIEEKSIIMKKHLNKVLKIATKYNFNCEIWGDMYLHAAYDNNKDNSAFVKNNIPSNLKLCCWDYYHDEEKDYIEMIEKYKKLSSNISFASGAWTWLGFCPNNTYSLRITKSAIKACIKKEIKEFYITMWGDNGGECSVFGVLPTLVAASQFAKNNFDIESIKKIFKEKIRMDYDTFNLLESLDRIYSKNDNDREDPSKVMLYTDPFFNIFEKRVINNTAKKYYQNVAKNLKKGFNKEEFAYLFKMEYSLAKVLEIKFELSKETKKAYKAKDLETLNNIANKKYPLLLKRLERFYNDFKDLWLKERKPFGFEVQDIRIGGVIQRIKYCRFRLNEFLNNKIQVIEELEEEILEPLGMSGEGIAYNYYGVLPTTYNI